MATLESSDSNILDAETINWRLVVYPVVAILLILVIGFGYYYNKQYQRDTLEDTARAALLQAKTPEDFVKVADQFPNTDQETLALLSAANGSFGKRDFDAAIKDYQRIINTSSTTQELIDSAQLGLASSLEANNKTDDAISAYLVVAQRGDKSFYAPFAYIAVANIYEQRGDKPNEIKILNEATTLNQDSEFVKQAQYKLKELTATKDQMTIPVSDPASNAVPAAPVPVVTAPATAK